MLGSGDEAWEWILPNPGANKAHLVLSRISRQVDNSFGEQATFQSCSHFPPLLEVGVREVVVDIGFPLRGTV